MKTSKLNLYMEYFHKNFKQIVTYIIFGVLTTAVNFIVYLYMTRTLGVEKLISNAVAWILAVLFAYITNKIYVFENKNYSISHISKEMSMFIFARMSSGVIDMLLLWVGIYNLHLYDVIVKFFTSIIVIILNYVLSKFWIFKRV